MVTDNHWRERRDTEVRTGELGEVGPRMEIKDNYHRCSWKEAWLHIDLQIPVAFCTQSLWLLCAEGSLRSLGRGETLEQMRQGPRM